MPSWSLISKSRSRGPLNFSRNGGTEIRSFRTCMSNEINTNTPIDGPMGEGSTGNYSVGPLIRLRTIPSHSLHNLVFNRKAKPTTKDHMVNHHGRIRSGQEQSEVPNVTFQGFPAKTQSQPEQHLRRRCFERPRDRYSGRISLCV